MHNRVISFNLAEVIFDKRIQGTLLNHLNDFCEFKIEDDFNVIFVGVERIVLPKNRHCTE